MVRLRRLGPQHNPFGLALAGAAHVLPLEPEHFAPAHAGLQHRFDAGAQMSARGHRELGFLARVQPTMARLFLRQLHVGLSLAAERRFMLAVVMAHGP